MGWTSRGNRRAQLALLALTAGALLLAALPTAALDGAPVFCLFRWMGFGHCPGCGMTHALSHLLHARFGEAVAANWRVLLVAPLLAAFYSRVAWQALGPDRPIRWLRLA